MKRLRISKLVVVFVLGLAFGALGSDFLALGFLFRPKDADTRRELFIRRFGRQYQLGPADVESLRALLVQHQAELDQLKQEMLPRIEAVRDRQRLAVRDLLKPEQQQRFDAMHLRMRQQMENSPRFRNRPSPWEAVPPPPQ